MRPDVYMQLKVKVKVKVKDSAKRSIGVAGYK